MTSNPPETSEPSIESQAQSQAAPDKGRGPSVQTVLERLFELYPHLFGAEFLPLKLGIFQELLAAHPDLFQREPLKAALGVHTRSARYLQSVAAGTMRHDLQGAAVENVAPEHVYFAVLELFRRRQGRVKGDLRPAVRSQLMAAFEASGLSRQDYLARVQSNATPLHPLLEEAFAERDQALAKQEALLRTFDASGKSVEEFADMYGVDARELRTALSRSGRDALSASVAG